MPVTVTSLNSLNNTGIKALQNECQLFMKREQNKTMNPKQHLNKNGGYFALKQSVCHLLIFCAFSYCVGLPCPDGSYPYSKAETI